MRLISPAILFAFTAINFPAADALAQDGPADPSLVEDEPFDPPPGGEEQVEDAREVLPRVGTETTPVMPTEPPVSDPVRPGLTGGADWMEVLHETLETDFEPSTLAEGAFIIGREGRLVQAPGDLLIFVPHPINREPGEGPVLLMPSRALGQLQQEWTGQPVRVSGEIFTYHGRNQLLLAAYELLSEDALDPAAQRNGEQTQTQEQVQPSDPATPDQADESTAIEADPAVRDLLDELERGLGAGTDEDTSVHQQLESEDARVSRRAPVAISEDAPFGLVEGTLILRRPARMTRDPSGAWALVFDNDEPKAPHAPKLTVLPCRTLMQMERIALTEGDQALLLVSGRIYTYRGSLYILPTLVQRVPPSDINPLQ